MGYREQDWSNAIETRLRSPVGEIVYRRDPKGRLLGIRYGERVYLTQRGPWASWDGDFARWREERIPDGVTRRVETRSGCWTERYLWDASDRLVHIDGVDIRRDEQGRVIACHGAASDAAVEGHRWFYHYEKNGLASVTSPAGSRVISVGPAGRPLAWAGIDCGQCRYDPEGQRQVPALSSNTLRDAGSRVWAELDGLGNIASTFLWDGHRCLARIDGPLGGPLAAVFCLDPSGTPVRAIYPDRVERRLRDAYGEGLLEHPDLPGLFGGYQADGLVHLPWRTLDPRLGTFTAPDPFSGGEDDPRRGPRASFKGPLTVEAGAPSPYAIARQDPVGRTDPTGAISGLLLLSDFTWSWQNNLLTFFGIDLWFNLVMSLFTGFQLGNFGSSEVLRSSDRLGAGAIRRDGFIAWMTGGRAFTTQHLVWAPASEFDDLERGWVIDPQGDFRPTLYGTLLRAAPTEETPFLLRGMRDPGADLAAALDWSRQGGTAAFAAPNLPRPIFPAGGFHLNGYPLAISGNRDCPLTELEPAAGLAVGTFEPRAVINLPSGASVPALGGLALLSDANGDLVLSEIVTSISDGTRRMIRLEDYAPAIGPTGVSLEVFEPTPASLEALQAVPMAVSANSLTAIGATATYAANDLLRLTASTGDVTVARVAHLEARLPLNQPLPAGMAGPIQLTRMRAAATGPNGTMVSGTTVHFTGATAPVAGTLGLIVSSAGADPVPVRIDNASNIAAAVLDTDISATHAAGAVIQFRPVSVQGDLGRRADAAEAGSFVTYTPLASGAAPDGSAAPVPLRAASGSTQVLRLISAAPIYDAVVLDRAFAGSGPWTVERLRRRAGTSVQTGLTIQQAVAFVSPDAAQLDGAAAVRLIRAADSGSGAPAAVGGALVSGLAMTPAAGGTPAFGAGSYAPGTHSNPRPGQPVILRQGGTDALAVVTRLQLTFTLDRALAGLAADNLQCVQLIASGPVYTAELLGANQLALNPEIRTTGRADVAADFLRVREGEILAVTEAAGTQWFRVQMVRGGRLDLDTNAALAGSVGDKITVQRMLPDDPGNGHWLLGQNGASQAGNRLQFDVTSGNLFPTGRVIGVIDGNRTWPAAVTGANQDLRVSFAADPGIAAGTAIDLFQIDVKASEDVAEVMREDQALLATVAMGASVPGEVALAQAFTASSRVAASARLSPGTLLIPNDEQVLVDRRQSLVDHELTHTVQYTQWGPLWFCYFPMLLLELPVELLTDLELPDYGPFVSGSLAAAGTRWEFTSSNLTTLGVQTDDKVQLVQGATIARMVVVAVEAQKVTLRTENSGASAPPTGNLHVRRIQDEKKWEVTHSILQLFTHGGLLNMTAGSTWSGLIWLIAKGIYGIYRAIKGTGDLYPFTVENNGIHLRPSTEAGRLALANGGRITIKQGDSVLVRQSDVNEGVLVITPPVAFQDTVQVGLYDTHEPGSYFDWYDYYAGTVPDLTNRFVLNLPGNGNRFSVLDRVEVQYQAQSFRTEVQSVDGDNVQLQDPVPLNGAENSVRIAKIGENDATGNWDSAAMTELGMGWMKWLFDPWGQFDRTVDFQNEYVNLIPRIARYLFGTQMYSLLPFLGYLFYGRFFVAEHLAKIEQQASGESGDLYSPLSRLTGQIGKTDSYGQYRMLVGDIARFRFWTVFRTNKSLIDTTHQMEPGVFPANEDLRTVVFRSATAAAADPNGTTESSAGPARTPARAAADLFAAKLAGDPLQLDSAVKNPTGLTYTELAQVPEQPTALRHRSVYMAFTQPGQHRLTTRNGIDSATSSQEAREVQEQERQTIFFDVEALDVTVTLAGRTVNEGDTLDLLPMQRVTVAVTAPAGAPSGPRRWRLTVRRPEQGDRLRQPANLTLQTRAVIGTSSPVELSRYYPWNAADNSYVDGGLQGFGLHLGGDVDIPVRRFSVKVVDVLPLRASADASAAAVADLAQDTDGFLLIPSPVIQPLQVASYDGRPHAPGASGDPAFSVVDVTPVPAEAQSLVGAEGRLYRIRFAATPALTAPIPIRVEVRVGEARGTQAQIHCDFNLTARP